MNDMSSAFPEARLSGRGAIQAGGRTVHVVMAVFEPNVDFLRAQLLSVAAQTFRSIHLHLIIADLSSAQIAEREAESLGLEFSVIVPDGQLNAYKAFELGLERTVARMQPDDLVALCDQDDIWAPDKLTVLTEEIDQQGVSLVHSDARVVSACGDELHGSLFALERRLTHCNLRDLLYRNTVTGMTCLFTRFVAEVALPFPRQTGMFFHHDLWIALVARSLGGVEWVDKRLVDYRQHGANVVGAVDANPRGPKRFSRTWMYNAAGSYFVANYLAKSLYLRLESIGRAEDIGVDRSQLRTLKAHLSVRGLGAAFFSDSLRYAFMGQSRLAAQALKFGMIRMSRFAAACSQAFRRGINTALAEIDARGYRFAPGHHPGLAAVASNAGEQRPRKWREFQDERLRRNWVLAPKDVPLGYVVLLPTLNPSEAFAGIATAIDLGIHIAARGIPVRFVACNIPIASKAVTLEFIRSRAAKANLKRSDPLIEVYCGATGETVPCSSSDQIVATAWWTAHLAQELVATSSLAAKQFIYLIQDYEPGFYAWGDEFAAALASYDMAFVPIFNTRLLREHFCELGYRFANSNAFVFGPSVDVSTYAARPRRSRSGSRRVVLYGRPEVSRNLFGTGVQALAKLVEDEALGPRDIELSSVGMPHEDILMPNGLTLKSLGKIAWEDYAAFLSTVDVGLSLMLSPHPSHVPLEMAAAGAHVVTNRFGCKDLSALSPLIASAPASVADLATALQKALHAPAAEQRDRDISLTVLGAPLQDAVSGLLEMRNRPDERHREMMSGLERFQLGAVH